MEIGKFPADNFIETVAKVAGQGAASCFFSGWGNIERHLEKKVLHHGRSRLGEPEPPSRDGGPLPYVETQSIFQKQRVPRRDGPVWVWVWIWIWIWIRILISANIITRKKWLAQRNNAGKNTNQ
jgi:hypothetical protein